MTVADKLTASRIIIAPIFYALIFITGGRALPALIILWVLFLFAELTDALDGAAARRMKEVSDFGKLFDPFADTLMHIIFFFTFTQFGILNPIPFLIILIRESSVQFLRNLMLKKKGIAQGARWLGKTKTVSYFLTCVVTMVSLTMQQFGYPSLAGGFSLAANILFVIAALLSIISFIDYFRVYKRA
ncbi:MAG: CDP-diacylglycerol--glycerol-3-phosphate 3-phosphatidyltransferase [Spirochaetaceae bacterium]|jgi:CDP-diacylglycerol--glycerol-3-phosphate 3-phosphatidyltransferase|nr:CDP-diacylglycerol--glycerol-3-phosphate 3-phosphatidyltransferase [Spirochaetaceae bacterium]